MPRDRPPSLESVFWVKLEWANSMGKSKHNRNCAPKYVDVVVRMWEMSVGRRRRYRCVLEECVWILSDVILLTTGGGEDCWGHNGPFNNAFFFSMVTRLPLRRRAVIHIRVSGSVAIYLGHIFLVVKPCQVVYVMLDFLLEPCLWIPLYWSDTFFFFFLVNWLNVYFVCCGMYDLLMAGHLFVTPWFHWAETDIVSHDGRVQSWLQSFSMQLARESLGVSIMGTVKSDFSAARNSLAFLLGLCYMSTERLLLSQYCKNPVLKQRNVASYRAVRFTRFLRERFSVWDAPVSVFTSSIYCNVFFISFQKICICRALNARLSQVKNLNSIILHLSQRVSLW